MILPLTSEQTQWVDKTLRLLSLEQCVGQALDHYATLAASESSQLSKRE